MERRWSGMDLPGFRFHPTEEELLDFYLKGAVHGRKLQNRVIQTLNIYRHDPWELPGMAGIGEREWYFLVPRDRRSSNSGRPNRTTERGFWKATGSDRRIRCVSDPGRVIGVKKTLVFYKGRAPRGTRTDWVMNEYRLPEDDTTSASRPKEDIVLCKVYRKATPMKELEQRAATDKDASAPQYSASADDNSSSSSSSCSSDKQISPKKAPVLPLLAETDVRTRETKVKLETQEEAGITSVPLGVDTGGKRTTPGVEMLQVPPSFGFDWSEDPFLTQLGSPWLENWFPYYANVLSL